MGISQPRFLGCCAGTFRFQGPTFQGRLKYKRKNFETDIIWMQSSSNSSTKVPVRMEIGIKQEQFLSSSWLMSRPSDSNPSLVLHHFRTLCSSGKQRMFSEVPARFD